MTILRRLGDLTIKVGSGATPRGGQAVYTDEGVAFVRSQNVLDNAMRLDDVARISDEAAYQLRGVTIQEDDVLLNITGDSIARVCLADPAILPARVSQHVAIIRTGPELDSRFLQRFLVQESSKAHLLSISDGGTRKALTKASIESLMVSVPSLVEQRGIADVLGALDDKIATNAKLIGAVQALMTALASTSCDSTTISIIARHSTASVSQDEFDPDVAHFSLPAFDNGGRPDFTRGDSIKSTKFLVDAPTVLMSKLNPRIPRIWNVPRVPDVMSLASTEFVVMEPIDVDPSELWSVLAQPEVSTTLTGKVAGTSGSHQRVKPAELLALRVKDPRTLPAAVRTSIRELGLVCDLRRDENASLAKVRDVLLPLLMSGKIRVKDAERVLAGETVGVV